MMDSEKRLRDQVVLVTRPRVTAETPLVDRLHAAGASVILHPVINISQPENWDSVDDVLTRLSEFGTVAFLSSPGVQYFFGRFREVAGQDGLDACKIASLGRATAEKIRSYGETVDFIPEVSDSDSMAERLSRPDVPEPILLLRANRGSDAIANSLRERNKKFEEVSVYESHDIERVHPQTLELMQGGRIDWVTITSSAIARSTVSLFGPALRNTKLASISPTTSQALRQAGFEADVEATEHNFDGIVKAISNFEQRF